MNLTHHIIREQWEFRCDRQRWRWRRRDCEGCVVSASTETFASLREAIEHARTQGFSERSARA